MVHTASQRGALPPMRRVVTRDVLRPISRTVFEQVEQHIPRYTGHIPGTWYFYILLPPSLHLPISQLCLSPRSPDVGGIVAGIKNTYGITFGSSSATMIDATRDRDEPLQMHYSTKAALRKLECNKSIVGGPTMNGLIEPYTRSPSRLEPLSPQSPGSSPGSTIRSKARDSPVRTHLQGSEVDKDGYYATLIGNDYKGLRVKTGWNPERMGPPTVQVGSGNPHRNYSAISLGDRFYFNGPHMFHTTYSETSQSGLDKSNVGGRLSPEQG